MFDCYYSSDWKQMHEMSKKKKKKNTRGLYCILFSAKKSSANIRSDGRLYCSVVFAVFFSVLTMIKLSPT